jgi:GNAT superfamily N-acetyltransferase
LEDFDSSTQDEEIWVAEEGGLLVGFVSIFREDNFIHNLYVEPKQPPRGIGSALLKTAEATFTDMGTLKCLVQNERALAFYLKNGWHIISAGDAGKDAYYLMGSGTKAV